MYHSGQTGLQIFLSILECSLFGAYKSLTGSVETDSKRENCAYKTRAGKKQPRRKERETLTPSLINRPVPFPSTAPYIIDKFLAVPSARVTRMLTPLTYSTGLKLVGGSAPKPPAYYWG